MAFIKIDRLFLFILPVMFIMGEAASYAMVFISMLLHELGHIITALYLGEKLISVRVLAVGLNALFEERVCGRRQRIAVYSSGPLVNIILSGIFTFLNSYYLLKSDNMRFFILMNIYLAAFNLLPVLPLDGGRILREILMDKVGIFSARNYVRKISFILACFLVTFGVIQLINTLHNFSLLSIGIYIFLCLKHEDSEAAIMNVKHVIYRRSRLMKKGIYPARDLVVIKAVRLSEVIKNMDFDRFHIIYVLDEELKLIGTYTEQEIIDGMLKHSGDMTFDEFMKV